MVKPQFKVGDKVIVTKGLSYASKELDGRSIVINGRNYNPSLNRYFYLSSECLDGIWEDEIRLVTPLDKLL